LPTGIHSLTEDEGDDPYRFGGPAEQPCPGCGRALPEDVSLCPSCGFDRTTGARKRRRYEPVHRSWEAGWPLPRRGRPFVLGQMAALPLGVLGAWYFGTWGALVGPWVTFSVLTAFLLGTYARVEVTRTERGKVTLTQTWRVCFFVRPTQVIRRGDYEG